VNQDDTEQDEVWQNKGGSGLHG